MTHISRLFLTCIFAACLVVFQSCFPTKSEDENEDEGYKEQKDPTEITSDPEDLPENGDPDADVSSNGIDSMFSLLVKRVETLEEAEDHNDFFNKDFESLRKGFATAVSQKPDNEKANIGYIVSAVCALNTSNSLKMAIDSMDAYIKAVDEYYYEDPEYVDYYVKNRTDILAKRKSRNSKKSSLAKTNAVFSSTSKNIFAKSFQKFGIQGLGRVLLAESPKILVAQTKKPSFPAFITINFIQGIVEDDIIPRLNEVVSACKRLESNNVSINLNAFDENFELDVGDIYMFEAGIRLVRAALGFFITYDMDLYSPDGSSTIKWIDNLYDNYTEGRCVYRLKGDTLHEIWVYDVTKYTEPLCDVMQYNLKRSGFLCIRRENHEAVYEDLLAVPQLVKTGIESIKSESDDQEDDLITGGGIFDFEEDMADFSTGMIEEGFSSDLAKHFKSPGSLMDFITDILTNEYTFSETIDGYDITMTVNLSNWFTNPVEDLRTLYPKHRLLKGDDRYVSMTSVRDKYSTDDNSFYVYENDVIDIPESKIASITNDEWGNKEVILNNYFSYCIVIDSTVSCMSYSLVDDDGNDITFEMIEEIFNDQQALEKYFPYFNDYTINGLFPKMEDRSDWIDFCSRFYD
ncbi:MAG: hypothetical protein GXY77_16705 [Fibrobacter sp.]|nr:hypothetical protein [Fibrobacter sp.]